MNNRVLKASGLILGGTGAAIAAAYLSTDYLLKVALDRDMPKTSHNTGRKIAGKKLDKEYKTELNRCSKQLAKIKNEEVEITTNDGIRLIGHLVQGEKPERIIIAVHGWRSSWNKDFGMISKFWSEHNCCVLYVEQRGQNNSGGDCIGLGLIERYDCIEWVNWVINRFGTSLPIYLAGVSMGATTVLYTAGMNLPKEVHGIIADCGFTSPDAIWKHIAKDNLHMFYGNLQQKLADSIFQHKTNELSSTYSTAEALRNTDVPVLFIHGLDDHFVPMPMTLENYNACASPKHLLVVPGADHGMSYFADKEGYEHFLCEFWNKYDQYKRSN